MSTIEKTEKEVVSAKNGKKYVITDAEGKRVKRVDVLKDFVNNDTLDTLDEDQELQNTKTLAKFLKGHLGENVVLSKSGFVKYNGFKMWYDSHGFKVVDMLNYNEVMNINEYNNDLAYPKDVLDFLKEKGDRPVTAPKKDKEKIRIIDKLSEKFYVKDVDGVKLVAEKPREEAIAEKKEQVEHTVEARRKERLEKAVALLFTEAEAKASVSTLKGLALKISQKKENVKLLNSLIVKFKKGKLTLKAFKKEVQVIADQLISRKAGERIVRAPKFTGLDFTYEPIEPEFTNERITFMQKDPAGKKFRVDISITEYLVNTVLSEFPKAMALLTKVASGEKFDIDEIDTNRFVKDVTVAYDARNFRNFNTAVNEMCLEICYATGLLTAFSIYYDYKLAKGTKVKVFWADSQIWCAGEVVSTETGVKVLYEDGSVEYVLKHQPVKIYS